MRKLTQSFALFCLVIFSSGCLTTGLSVREKGSLNYTNFLYGLYENAEISEAAVRAVKKPIKLAVAQVGEAAPPDMMLDRLDQNSGLISKTVVIPAGGNETSSYSNSTNPDTEEFKKRMDTMRRIAKDMGADYIFLFGGSIDYGSHATPWQFFDLTIIGGFILPGVVTEAEGRITGSLIDVQSGRMIFTVNADARQKKHSPTYLSDYNGDDRILAGLRDELVHLLTEKFLDKLSKDI